MISTNLLIVVSKAASFVRSQGACDRLCGRPAGDCKDSSQLDRERSYLRVIDCRSLPRMLGWVSVRRHSAISGLRLFKNKTSGRNSLTQGLIAGYGSFIRIRQVAPVCSLDVLHGFWASRACCCVYDVWRWRRCIGQHGGRQLAAVVGGGGGHVDDVTTGTLVPGHRFVVFEADSRCSSAVAPLAAFDLHNKQQVRRESFLPIEIPRSTDYIP